MYSLFILRGLPGSGKTTLANIIAPRVNACADDFMVDECGKYKFDPTKLSEAHKKCQDKIDYYMWNGLPLVAVHNTFTQLWEMEPYFDLAKKYHYSVQVIECKGQWQNVHGVPETTIQAMKERWEEWPKV